ncbi:hypothetical protein P3X46_028370 [Hevea brasiliensis]|uniref:Pseudouridine synthase I TruA alpha/beta domain-containing protein n=1 Tax=Hevea brasiliensis TaxID=3981 RepID=A0ABQ9KRS2_HEVBR|nr:uncharacterized protein LOC110672876 isoform X1 [Hevea brasiliensis]KAJ9146055.1 hypothetical protein P3X46_028370 [Hevea brasiliensis]
MSQKVVVEEEAVINLKSQIASLENRVKELEAENAKLSARLSNCRCNETEEKLDGRESGEVNPGGHETAKKKARDKISGYDTSTMNHHRRRFVALKIMYFGQRFYGFSSEGQMDPTVESEIFKALERTRLLIGDKKEIQYSRCGRTDKGVSAVGQVIALFLRSKLKDIDANNKNSGEIVSEEHEHNEGEIDYVRVLNRVLPNDIRIVGWCPVPNDFSARFNCLSREYKYFFWIDKLNLFAMESAGKKFIGEHDFRNFCKMDAVNVHNYRRHITSFEISPCKMRFEDNQLCAIKLKGSAFLWHQVRCMVAVLFMIGQGLESPNVIDVLLDIDRTPRKPQYPMASEIPLVLHSCEFEGLKFTCSTDAEQALRTHLENECQLYQLQAAIFHEALLSCLPLSNDAEINSDESSRNGWNGTDKKRASHVPLMSRPTEPSYEERRSKLENTKSRAR